MRVVPSMISGDSYNRGERIDSSKFGADPGLPTAAISSEVSASPDGGKPISAYRCKKCRRIVALEEHLVGHEPGEGETCFEWKKRKNSKSFNSYDEHECSSIFVEPLQWMKSGINVKFHMFSNLLYVHNFYIFERKTWIQAGRKSESFNFSFNIYQISRVIITISLSL